MNTLPQESFKSYINKRIIYYTSDVDIVRIEHGLLCFNVTFLQKVAYNNFIDSNTSTYYTSYLFFPIQTSIFTAIDACCSLTIRYPLYPSLTQAISYIEHQLQLNFMSLSNYCICLLIHPGF